MDRFAASSILLVADAEGDAIRCEEGMKRGRVRYHQVIFVERDVAYAELDRSCATVCCGHGVFAHPKEKEERNGGEVSN